MRLNYKEYKHYIIKSLQVFILCFIFGTFVDNQFYIYQKNIIDITKSQRLLLAFSQLFVIITITYLLNAVKFLNQFFEEYTPNVLFSTFLVSLQTTMIGNFKNLLE